MDENEVKTEDLSKVMAEVVNAMIRIDAENEYIKEALKDLEEKYEIPTKILRAVAKTEKDDKYNEKAEQDELFHETYEKCFKE